MSLQEARTAAQLRVWLVCPLRLQSRCSDVRRPLLPALAPARSSALRRDCSARSASRSSSCPPRCRASARTLPLPRCSTPRQSNVREELVSLHLVQVARCSEPRQWVVLTEQREYQVSPTPHAALAPLCLRRPFDLLVSTFSKSSVRSDTVERHTSDEKLVEHHSERPPVH